jgi:hypothetical protein
MPGKELLCPVPAFCPRIARCLPSCHPERSAAKSMDLFFEMFRLRGFAASLNMTKKSPAFLLRRVLL